MEKFKGFYFITNHQLSKHGNIHDVEMALQAGVAMIQYRDKSRPKDIILRELLEIKVLCKKYNIPLIINDYPELLTKIDADGLHLGQNDMDIREARSLVGADKIIGISVNNIESALNAQGDGAQYLGVGHIFHTSTKIKNYSPLCLDTLRNIRQHINIPITAIGGINRQNAREVISSGADMICAIKDTISSGQVREMIEEYNKLIFYISD